MASEQPPFLKGQFVQQVLRCTARSVDQTVFHQTRLAIKYWSKFDSCLNRNSFISDIIERLIDIIHTLRLSEYASLNSLEYFISFYSYEENDILLLLGDNPVRYANCSTVLVVTFRLTLVETTTVMRNQFLKMLQVFLKVQVSSVLCFCQSDPMSNPDFIKFVENEAR